MPDDLQALLAEQALKRAAMIIAEQAELFAVPFQAGTLQDRGAADALLLFANLLRESNTDFMPTVGSA